MMLWLLGVRGSTPAPGPEFVSYGGHTACVAVLADGAEEPTLVLDAGTGIRALTERLAGNPYRGAIMLSHLHWDHVQGIPFFAAGDRPDSEVELYLPAQGGKSGRDLLAGMMSPPSFPIEPEGLLGNWRFHALAPGRTSVGGFEVTAAEVTHKGGRTFGYRVADATGSFAYLPDHAPAQGCDDDVRRLVAGVDVLLHDAQFVESERALADLYGHATSDDAVRLASDAQVGTLVFFHHSPARTDDQLDALAQDTRAPMPIIVAHEGQTLAIPGGL
jgi:phosphoribosyl 1,2-cyclic phosphodiesterase